MFFISALLLLAGLVGIIGTPNLADMYNTRLRHSLLTVLFALLIHCLSAQAGLWEVTNVSVGQETMTPVAKWFDISEDGTVLSGNGGVINIRGTYTYDPKTSEAIFTDRNGEPDEFGAFKISFDDEKMTWKRTENGMHVVVSLVKVKDIPDGPWDKCIGDWSENDSKTNVSMWWDRRYTYRSEGSDYQGTWFIHAHQPRLTLYRQDGQRDEWKITFPTDSTMVWASQFGDDRTFTKQGGH